ncbi:MAG: enoyl-CoA hydratase-related protein [Bacteriovoracia bacterium]
MAFPKVTTLKVTQEGSVVTVLLNRPEVRNAFNDVLISDLQKTFDAISKSKSIRMVIFKGAGLNFCAGGDLNWMQKSIKLTKAQNLVDTKRLTKMFHTLNACPKPVIGFVQGAAIGGGVGLVSICDYVVATQETVFSLSEVRLGIIPACIGPFVVAKIGESYARAYFISAERFRGKRAYEIGLVHEVVENNDSLLASEKRITQNLLQCGPNAMVAAKRLIREIKTRSYSSSLQFVSKNLAELRVSPEGQDGLKAFLEKRKPKWMEQ